MKHSLEQMQYTFAVLHESKPERCVYLSMLHYWNMKCIYDIHNGNFPWRFSIWTLLLARCAGKLLFWMNTTYNLKYRHSSFNMVLLLGILSNTVFFNPKTVLIFYQTRFFFRIPKICQKIARKKYFNLRLL